jgi:hypothetical protein
MNLHFEGLELECTALGPVTSAQPYEDWITCQVHVRVLNFAGSFQWQVMAGEIATLATDLEAANRRIGKPTVVRFFPAEPNVGREFAFNELGQIAGKYRFRGERTGFEPELAGRFAADQTYVASIVAELQSILAEARTAV